VMAAAMFYFASFNLSTDYRHEALARVIQGLGIAFLFVPTSQLAYSYLPKNKNNKASSLTNLFRNQGGSFGIAFVTTMLERRTQYHHTVLASHVSSHSVALSTTLAGITAHLVDSGYSAADATIRAAAQVSAIVQRESSIYGFLDCYWLLGAIALVGAVLSLFIRGFNQSGDGAAH